LNHSDAFKFLNACNAMEEEVLKRMIVDVPRALLFDSGLHVYIHVQAAQLKPPFREKRNVRQETVDY